MAPNCVLVCGCCLTSKLSSLKAEELYFYLLHHHHHTLSIHQLTHLEKKDKPKKAKQIDELKILSPFVNSTLICQFKWFKF